MLLQMAWLPSFFQVKIILLCIPIILCFPVIHLWAFVIVVQSLSHVQLSVTPWTTAPQASLSFTISWSLLKLMSVESVMPSNHLILCHPLLLRLQSFPASGVFLKSQVFESGGWSIEASASVSVLPMDSQGWFLLGLTGFISLQSSGLSRVFSSTTIWMQKFFGAQLSLWSNSHWKKHSFDYTDLGQQSDGSLLCLACVFSHFGCVQLFSTLRTVAHQAALSMGILQAGILEWVVMPSVS